MAEKTLMKKNLTSGINGKKTSKTLIEMIEETQEKKSINKKPLNPVGTTEGNWKIVDTLNFLVPQNKLRKSVILAPSRKKYAKLW